MPETGDTNLRAFRFRRDARSTGTILVIGAWALAVGMIAFMFGARGWIVVLLTLPLLPALWELWRNPVAWLELSEDRLRWQSVRSSADIALGEIDHILLVTRWDFSIRATVHTRIGTHHRIPAEVTPKLSAFEEALAARQIAMKRQHFTVL